MQEEKILQKKIVKTLGSRHDVRAFRNDVGLGYHGTIKQIGGVQVLTNPKPFCYGLQVGVSDILGLKKVRITPEMVGKEIAVFIALEVKTEQGAPTPEQINFVSMVRRFGGIADFVRSIEEAEDVVNNYSPIVCGGIDNDIL